MNLNTVSSSHAFGFYNYDQAFTITSKISETNNNEELTFNSEEAKHFNYLIIIHNISNVLGYTPIIGTIVGIARLATFLLFDYNLSKDSTNQDPEIKGIKTFSTAHKIRALIEITSLGYLLLIPDLIFSTVRLMENEKEAI